MSTATKVNTHVPNSVDEILHSEQILLSTTLRCLEEGIITMDSKEKIILLNRMAKKLTGWSQEEAFGKPLSEVLILLNSKTRKPAKNIMEKALASDKSCNLPKHSLLISRDQTEYHIGGTAALIRGNDSQVIGAVLAFRDITENVQAEEALERQAHDLGKRVKELHCLYGISALVEKNGSSLKKVFKEVAGLILPSLERPERSCVRLTIEGKSYTSEAFQETEWKHESIILANDQKIGSLEVFLRQYDPEVDIAPFSAEEQNLINAVAGRLAIVIEIKQAEEALKQRLCLEGLIASISTKFITSQPENIDSGILFALQTMGGHMHFDQARLFQLDDNRQTLSLTHEWCAPGIEQQKERLQTFTWNQDAWWFKKLGKLETLHIPDVSELPQELAREKECLKTQAGRSLIAVPLVRAGQFAGFLGFNSFSALEPWAEKDVVFLETMANIISNALDRKYVDEALQESEHRMDMAIKGADLGIWNWNCQNGEIVIDPRGAEILGFPAVEMSQRQEALQPMLHPDDLLPTLQMWKQHLAGKIPYVSMENRIQTPDGKWKWALYCGKVIEWDESRKPLRATGTVLDITERKSAEEERAALERKLLQSQRIEALGRLSGGVAHDFNNILSPIICYTEMCLDELPPDHPLKNHLSQVLRSAQRAKDLTRQLLACGRKQVLEMKGVQLSELITAFDKMIRRTIREDIEIEIVHDPELYIIKADPSQIEQILLNLAVNAQDAMPNGGKLIISTSNVILDRDFCREHDDLKPGPYVKLVVSDTGHGMSPETLGHIFEPFYTTKELGKGTGLGLATVHGIVQQHSGCITVYSELGLGTIFKIYLPCSEAAVAPEAKAESQTGALTGQETVLVVEDEEQVRNLVTQILSARGYTVLSAANAEQAMQVASVRRAAIPLLITDVILPKTNGKDLYHQLSAKYPSLKVLFMSGYTSRVIAHHGILEPGVHFLQKPFSVQELAQKVRSLLDA